MIEISGEIEKKFKKELDTALSSSQVDGNNKSKVRRSSRDSSENDFGLS